MAKRFRDVSTNIEDGIDVAEKFKTALEMSGIKMSVQNTEMTVFNDGTCEMLDDVPLGYELPGLEEEGEEMIEM